MPETPTRDASGAPSAPGASAPLLEVRDIAKSFGPTQALRGVSLSVAPGEIHGLCGQNGAGKSTLVKILTGMVAPDEGTVLLGGEEARFARPADAQAAGIAVVDQELSLVAALSVEENIRLGAIDTPFVRRRGGAQARVAELLERVGIGHVPPGVPVQSLSMPQRQLVEIARLLDRDARLLILDEPTASLSRGDSLVVFAALRELAARGHSVLYVSHRLDEVLDLCHRITVIRDGRRVADAAAADLEHDQLVRLIVGEDQAKAMAADRAAATKPAGDPTVEIRHVRVPNRVEEFAFSFAPGQIVGLAGQVGSGATEILRAVAGLDSAAEAELEVAGTVVRPRRPVDSTRAGIAFVSNDRRDEGLFLSRPIEENLVATRLDVLSRALGLVSRVRRRKVAAKLAEDVGVRGRGITAEAVELSGGNQQKVFIGRCLDRDPSHLLLLDEPTRGVDAGGRADIHALIRSAGASGTAVLFNSGEPDELLELADVIVCLQNGRVVSVHASGELDQEALLRETTRGRTADQGVIDAV